MSKELAKFIEMFDHKVLEPDCKECEHMTEKELKMWIAEFCLLEQKNKTR